MPITTLSFDLTGTLMRPFPSIGELCVSAMKAQKIQSIPDAAVFNSRRTEARRIAQSNGHSPTSEMRSRQYWRAMLWEIFAGRCSNKQFDVSVEFIYNRLSEPEHWELMPGVVPALSALKFLGMKMVVLSNGDSRWKKALSDKNLSVFFDDIFVSAETGFAKPSADAFDNVCQKMKIPRGELLHIGDTLAEDIVPAVNFGAEAAWVTRRPDGLPPKGVRLFETLEEIPEFVREKITANFQQKNLTRTARDMIADLRGLPEEDVVIRDFDGMGGKSASARRIAGRSIERIDRAEMDVPLAAPLFQKVLIGKGIYAGSLQSRIQQNWNDIVPARFVDRSRPVSLEKNMSVLTVYCGNATIRAELEFQKINILKKIHALPNGNRIKKIVFTLGA